MMELFDVLALPIRRDLVASLRKGPAPVSTLVDLVGERQPVISKQLRILREAGFVSVRHNGRQRIYTLRPEPFRELAEWLQPYQELWEHRLDLLGDRLDVMAKEEQL